MKKIIVFISISLLLLTFTPAGAEDTTLPTSQQQANIPVTIQTEKGDPAYTIVIPESINLTKVKQSDEVFKHSFNIEVREAKYLDNLKIYTVLRPFLNDEFVLTGQTDPNNKLPYYIVNNTNGTDTRNLDLTGENSHFAYFEENGIAECEFCIDTSLIEVVDMYSGEMQFLFYVDN